MPKIDDLVAYLNKRNISVEQKDKFICFDQKFYLDDGTSQIIRLEVYPQNDQLLVKAADKRFPNFCPNRHINYGGFFCLGLDSDIEHLSVIDWLKIVRDFLSAQHECEIKREWPTKQWAHGDGAIYQRKVEEYYREFLTHPLNIKLEDLQVNEVEKKGKKLYNIYLNGSLLLIGDENKPLNKRYSCICEHNGLKKHRSIGKCTSRCAYIIYTVAVNDFLRVKAEQKFWELFISSENIDCCKTMQNCELCKN
jgi:hypothetical protein